MNATAKILDLDHLIKTADGGVKGYRKRKPWYTLGISITSPEFYSLEEQLEAIDLIGELGGDAPVQYLEGLLEVQEHTEGSPGRNGELSWDETTTIYPNAKGKLRKVLDHRVWSGGDIHMGYPTHTYADPKFEHTIERIKNALATAKRKAEPNAPPNGGPVASGENSNAPGGPPSVS